MRRRYCGDCGTPLRLRLCREGGRRTFNERTGQPRRTWALACPSAIDYDHGKRDALLEARSWHTVRRVWRQSRARLILAAALRGPQATEPTGSASTSIDLREGET